MVLNINTISARASAFITGRLLSVADYRDIYGMLGSPPVPRKDKLPLHSSKTVQWRRYEHLPKSTAPLVEGVTPDGVAVTVTDLTESLTQYGSYVVLSDLSIETTEDPQLQIWGDRGGDQAIRSLTEIREGTILGGTSVYYANGTDRVGLNTLMDKTDWAKVERTLALNRARRLTKLLSATNGYNTTPIPAAYFAVCHTYVKYDLEQTVGETNGFVPVQKYSQATAAIPGEFGAIGRIRFTEHEEMTYFGHAGAVKGATGYKTDDDTNLDVFATMVFGEEAVGLVPFGGYTGMSKKGKGYDGVKGIVKALGSGGTDDPLDQRATVGWKGYEATKRLNELWMVRAESCASS
jgi:N4-gp56 family major capsid protein